MIETSIHGIAVNSAFWGKDIEFKQIQELILANEELKVPHKNIIYKYLAAAIKEASNSNLRLNVIRFNEEIKIIHNQSNVYMYGVYLESYMMEYGLLSSLELMVLILIMNLTYPSFN